MINDAPPDLTLTGPCIGVCKYIRPGPAGDHCIGCSMTEDQKAAFKDMHTDAERLAALQAIVAQQALMGGFSHWPEAYTEKCDRKGMRRPDLGEAA